MDSVLTDIFTSFCPLPYILGAVPLLHAVHKIEDVTSITWYRDSEYQIQMFAVPGNYIIPEHTHPNVDSYEIYVGGQIKFSHKGIWMVQDDELTNPLEDGTSSKKGTYIRVRPNELHGGVFGPAGGVFMSVQRWLNGIKPHCVGADYTGPVMGMDHFRKVVSGVPIPQDQSTLSAKDAASLS
jgi:hypothetical protein